MQSAKRGVSDMLKATEGRRQLIITLKDKDALIAKLQKRIKELEREVEKSPAKALTPVLKGR